MSEDIEDDQSYQVHCVEHVIGADGHTHISDVGLLSLGGGINTYTVEWALDRMAKHGNEFYTIGTHSEKKTDVEPCKCLCGVERIKTEPDDRKDNNLDNLIRCSNWVPL